MTFQACFPEENGWAITTYFKDAEYQKAFKEVHYGIDIAYQKEYHNGPKNILCIAHGTIAGIQKSTSKEVANAIRIEHDNLIPNSIVHTRYYHLSEIAPGLKKGDAVYLGQLLGTEGSTGNATGSHLHFEMWVAPKGWKWNYKEAEKYAVNPLEYLFLYKGQNCINNNGDILNYHKSYFDNIKEALKVLREV